MVLHEYFLAVDGISHYEHEVDYETDRFYVLKDCVYEVWKDKINTSLTNNWIFLDHRDDEYVRELFRNQFTDQLYKKERKLRNEIAELQEAYLEKCKLIRKPITDINKEEFI